MKQLLDRIRIRFGHFRSSSDIEAEMRVHAELEAEDLRANGVSPAEAQRLANAALGNRRVAIERLRDGEFVTHVEGWFRDITFAVRALSRNPAFSITAILTLALGIGANTAIFSLLYGLVLKSLPVAEASRLVEVGLASRADTNEAGNFLTKDMLTFVHSNLKSVGALSGWVGMEAPVEDNDGSLRTYSAAFVTGNAYEVMSQRPILGRLIAPFDDVRGGPPQGWPVVLSYGFWNDHFGRDRNIVGKRIRVSGANVVVVGVMQPEFKGIWPGTDVKLYLPLQFLNVLFKEDVLNTPNSLFGLEAIGRLIPGASISTANAELKRLERRLLTQFIPTIYQHDPFIEQAYTRVISARSGVPTYVRRTYAKSLYLMQGLVAMVLLLCCVNVGGLMMARVYTRQREFAIRLSLGAHVWRLLRQYMAESLLLAIAGSAFGALLTWHGTNFLLRFFRDPMMGESMQVSPDRSTLFFAGTLAILTTLACGVLPAWRSAHSDPGHLLKTRSSLGGQRHVAGRAFVPIQVALSLVLATLASLLSQSVFKLRSEHTGFDIDHVTIQTSPMKLLRLTPEQRLDLYQSLVDQLEEMPDIRSAAATSKTPMTGEEVMSSFQPRSDQAKDHVEFRLAFNDVGPGYFRTMQTAIVSGREFEKADRSLKVCVLNRSAARLLFPREEALGRYVQAADEREFKTGTECRVIGIAEDAKFSDVRQGPPPTIYFPLSLERMKDKLGDLVFLINSGTKSAAVDAFRKVLAKKAPTLPLVLFVTLREQMDAALGSEELITFLSNFFALIALLLSALGLYGLLSASVTQRSAEIGMRIAVGADPRRVIRLIVREAMAMVLLGLLLGAFGLVFFARLVANMLHGVSPSDPVTLISVLGVLLAVSSIAALLPALRAASVDPIQALRVEM